ncbi:MAG TPA: hypothetical protein VFW10_12125 [Steroidobacteraceae bacterium]|nr:hypothetical protein [Steroidobacteraceae bacterium]
MPGETTLVSAALVAGATGKLSIVLVLLAAVCGAVIADNFSFLMGRRFGFPLVVVLLRAWEAFMAGADAMSWRRFAPTNAGAILIWAGIWGGGAWWIGEASTGVLKWIGIGIFVVVAGALIARSVYFHRHEDELEARADEALPGPLCAHRPSDLKPTSLG